MQQNHQTETQVWNALNVHIQFLQLPRRGGTHKKCQSASWAQTFSSVAHGTLNVWEQTSWWGMGMTRLILFGDDCCISPECGWSSALLLAWVFLTDATWLHVSHTLHSADICPSFQSHGWVGVWLERGLPFCIPDIYGLGLCTWLEFSLCTLQDTGLHVPAAWSQAGIMEGGGYMWSVLKSKYDMWGCLLSGAQSMPSRCIYSLGSALDMLL